MQFVSKLSLAIALATGAVALSTAMPEPAQAAKDKPKQLKLSKDFRSKAAPLQEKINGDNPASAKAELEALLGSGLSGDDLYMAGQFAISLGGKIQDLELQAKGIDAMLASGSASPEEARTFSFHKGNMAYSAEDYTTAVQTLQPLWDSGYRENSIGVVLAQSLFSQGQSAQGLSVLGTAIGVEESANGKAPESWYRVASAQAYQADNSAEFQKWTLRWAQNYPSQNSWNDAIAAYRINARGDAQMNLEVLRFMHTSGAMSRYNDYKEYAEEASKRFLWNDVVTVLQDGRQAGVISAGDPVITDYLNPAQGKISGDKASLPQLPSGVKFTASDSADKKARVLMNYADNWLAYEEYDTAVAFYEAARAASPAEADRANIGIGSSHALSGDTAAAQTALGQVGGQRAGLAKLWMAWLGQQATASAAPAAEAATQS